jgi:hypothetical protein
MRERNSWTALLHEVPIEEAGTTTVDALMLRRLMMNLFFFFFCLFVLFCFWWDLFANIAIVECQCVNALAPMVQICLSLVSLQLCYSRVSFRCRRFCAGACDRI